MRADICDAGGVGDSPPPALELGDRADLLLLQFPPAAPARLDHELAVDQDAKQPNGEPVFQHGAVFARRRSGDAVLVSFAPARSDAGARVAGAATGQLFARCNGGDTWPPGRVFRHARPTANGSVSDADRERGGDGAYAIVAAPAPGGGAQFSPPNWLARTNPHPPRAGVP